MMFVQKKEFSIVLLLVLAGVVSRLIPHPANFTALSMLGLFSGFYLKNFKHALIAVFGIMLFSDLLIGFYTLMPVIYIALLIPLLIGTKLRTAKHKAFFAISGGLLSALSFFIITNFAVWFSGLLYPKTIEGLMLCYTAGLPFLRNQLCGDAFYGVLLFAIFQLAHIKPLNLSTKSIA